MLPDDRLYMAEWLVHKLCHEAAVEDPQQYLEMVQGTRWFINRWPRVAARTIVVQLSEERWAGAYVEEGIITLPPWYLTDFGLLHELAHFCVKPVKDRSKDHRPEWVACELALVRRFMGRDAYVALKHGLKAVGRHP